MGASESSPFPEFETVPVMDFLRSLMNQFAVIRVRPVFIADSEIQGARFYPTKCTTPKLLSQCRRRIFKARPRSATYPQVLVLLA